MLPFESLKPVFYPQISKLPLSLQNLLFPPKSTVFPPKSTVSPQIYCFPSKIYCFPPKSTVFPPNLLFSLQN